MRQAATGKICLDLGKNSAVPFSVTVNHPHQPPLAGAGCHLPCQSRSNARSWPQTSRVSGEYRATCRKKTNTLVKTAPTLRRGSIGPTPLVWKARHWSASGPPPTARIIRRKQNRTPFIHVQPLRLRAGLCIGPGARIADLGCGNGGAGLWIARELGANLIGIDLSAGGVAAASERAQKLGLGGRAQFREGDMTATGLPSASCDGAISLDVLCFVPDKAAAINEVRRILCPGARFAFTTWDQEGYSTRLQAAQLADHRPLLTEAGFDIELYEEPPAWRQQQRAVLESLLALEQELAAELERPTVDRFLGMARGMLAEMPDRRYVSAIARRC
jgi:SAM-dependent methyltransferase